MLLPGLDLIAGHRRSQYLQGLLLPIVLVFMVLLVNDERLMGRHANGRIANVLAWIAVGLVVLLDAGPARVTPLGVFGIIHLGRVRRATPAPSLASLGRVGVPVGQDAPSGCYRPSAAILRPTMRGVTAKSGDAASEARHASLVPRRRRPRRRRQPRRRRA